MINKVILLLSIIVIGLVAGCTMKNEGNVTENMDYQNNDLKEEKQSPTVTVKTNGSSPDNERTMIYPDNRNIQYTGRINFENPKSPILTWSGSSIHINFEGTSLNLHLEDEGSQAGQNYYSLILDGKVSTLECKKGQQVYKIAEGLEDKIHSLKIVRRTEGWDGETKLLGFDLDKDKDLVAPSHRPALRIEFYGDSIISGFAIEDEEGNAKETKYKDYTKTFAALTARNLNAEEHVIALSGMGIQKSYDFDETMSNFYYRNDLAGLQMWDFNQWIPEIVVIHLGQNDYWQLQHNQPEEIKDAYIDFVRKIRRKYKDDTSIILTLGGIDVMSKASPFPKYIQEAIHVLRSEDSDTNVHYVIFDYEPTKGHPGEEIHMKMAEQLTYFIKQQIPDWDGKGEQITFDLNKTQQEFMGFGAQVWAYGGTKDYPKLTDIRNRALDELNIKYIRIENYLERASWEDMQSLREITEEKGIDWIYMIWDGPKEIADKAGNLKDPKAFASWWADHVEQLYQHGIEIEYIELMNEPDSNGAWSLGIDPKDYLTLVQNVRKELDKRGYKQVGIVGPGLASLGHGRPEQYIEWFKDTNGIEIGAWSTHIWEDDQSGMLEGGSAIEKNWTFFDQAIEEIGSNSPIFVTEYATKQSDFNSYYYKMPDDYGTWSDEKVFPYYSVSNIVPYAVRVYENTLALLNSGANAALVWQLNDEPTEVHNKNKSWGLMDLWGKPKPVYDALKTIFPYIPIGAQVVEAPNQEEQELYTGCFIDGKKVILGIANGKGLTYSSTIRIENGPRNLSIKNVMAFESAYYGNNEIGEPDEGRVVKRNLELKELGNGTYEIFVTLPKDSTLTIILEGK